MSTVVNFLSRVYGDAAPMVIGYFGFLLFNIVNVLYLVLVQGFVFGRLMRDPLLKLSLVGCLFQALSSASSVYSFNEVHSGSAQLIAGVCGIVAHASMDVAHTFVFFHHKYGMFIKIVASCFIAIGIYYIVGLNIHLKEVAEGKTLAEAKGFPPTFFFIASTIWQLVAIIRFRSALTKGEIQTNPTTMSPENMSKLFLVLIVLEGISVAFEMSEIWVFAFSFSGFQYSLCVTVMIYVGTMDFMTERGITWGGMKVEYDTMKEDIQFAKEVATVVVKTKAVRDKIKEGLKHENDINEGEFDDDLSLLENIS